MTSDSTSGERELARDELSAEWGRGNRVPAENYLARYSGLSTDPDAVVDLIFSEFLCRERAGERPDPEEFARRFPAHAPVLREQIQLHRALAAPPSDAHPSTGTAVASSTLPPQPVKLPRDFGRYTFSRVLGTGGMGTVVLAQDSQLGRQVALKVLRLDRRDPAVVDRFVREARLAATLHHPNLCPVYDVGRVDDTYYFTMPVIHGGTLAARLKQDGPMPEAEAVRIVGRIAAGMQAAHEAGIIHRDLKPRNVMLDDRDEPVVTDFGLARRVAGTDPRLTQSGAILGTPLYLPPEQIGGAAETMGPASDVYSLGAILYELLTGRPPFKGSSDEILRQVLMADPAPPTSLRPGLDRRFDAVCGRALAKDPRNRFASMADFSAALPRPDSPPARGLWRWTLFGAVLVVAGLTTWALWPEPKPNSWPTGPAVTISDEALLVVGSRWVGVFQFAGANDPAKPVMLRVTDRTGSTFRGRYTTEGKYEWEVEGTVIAGSVRWDLSKAMNKLALDTGATGKAYVIGQITGLEMRLTFHDTADGSQATMRLRRHD